MSHYYAPHDYRRYLGLDLKRAYQRNTIIGSIMVHGSIVLAVLVWTATAGPTVPEHIEIGLPSGLIEEVVPAVASTRLMSIVRDAAPAPRSGIVNAFRIIRDTPGPRVPSVDYATTTDQPAEFDPAIEPIDVPLPPIRDGLIDYRWEDQDPTLPVDDAYLPGMRPTRFALPSSRGQYGTRTPAYLLFGPLGKSLLKPGAPDTGYVVVDLVVGSQGQAWWEVLDERPAGYGFAAAYTSMLSESRFVPATREGVQVPTRLRLRVTVCPACESSVTTLQGDVVTGYLAGR